MGNHLNGTIVYGGACELYPGHLRCVDLSSGGPVLMWWNSFVMKWLMFAGLEFAVTVL